MKNLFKKITAIAIFSFVFIFSLNFVMADENDENSENGVAVPISNLSEDTPVDIGGSDIKQIMDTNAVNGVYKLSDDKNTTYLPMTRYVTDRIILDKETGDNFGSFFSKSSIEVNEKQLGVKCLFTNDTARVNAGMEYPIIFATQNVIIDSTIERSIIVFSGATVTFTENSEVKGDIICFSTNLELKGKVDGSVMGYSNKVDVTGTVSKDLRVDTNDLNVAGSDNVKGNVFVMTYNSSLTKIQEQYPAATVIVNESNNKVTKTDILKNIAKACIVCLVFAIINVLVNKKNSEFINKTMKVTKDNVMFLLLSGSLSLLLFPLVSILLLILAMVNFEFIAIPVLVLYLAFLIISGMLSTLIIGSMIVKYMTDKYLEKENSSMKFGFCFLTFLVLYGIARIPVVGSYITWGLVILSNGIVLARIFKSKPKNS